MANKQTPHSTERLAKRCKVALVFSWMEMSLSSRRCLFHPRISNTIIRELSIPDVYSSNVTRHEPHPSSHLLTTLSRRNPPLCNTHTHSLSLSLSLSLQSWRHWLLKADRRIGWLRGLLQAERRKVVLRNVGFKHEPLVEPKPGRKGVCCTRDPNNSTLSYQYQPVQHPHCLYLNFYWVPRDRQIDRDGSTYRDR